MTDAEKRDRRETLKEAFMMGMEAARQGEEKGLTEIADRCPFKRQSPPYLAYLAGARFEIIGPEIPTHWEAK